MVNTLILLVGLVAQPNPAVAYPIGMPASSLHIYHAENIEREIIRLTPMLTAKKLVTESGDSVTNTATMKTKLKARIAVLKKNAVAERDSAK
jgi:hypothetical protein